MCQLLDTNITLCVAVHFGPHVPVRFGEDGPFRTSGAGTFWRRRSFSYLCICVAVLFGPHVPVRFGDVGPFRTSEGRLVPPRDVWYRYVWYLRDVWYLGARLEVLLVPRCTFGGPFGTSDARLTVLLVPRCTFDGTFGTSVHV